MSSNNKAARWQLTRQLTEELGIDWDKLPEHAKTRLLYSAQQFLDKTTLEKVAELAKEWNTDNGGN